MHVISFSDVMTRLARARILCTDQLAQCLRSDQLLDTCELHQYRFDAQQRNSAHCGPQAAVTSGAGRRGAAGSHRLHLLFGVAGAGGCALRHQHPTDHR